MTKKQRAVLAVEALKQEYPDAICSLTYRDPLQLLIATRLSAQLQNWHFTTHHPFHRWRSHTDFGMSRVEFYRI